MNHKQVEEHILELHMVFLPCLMVLQERVSVHMGLPEVVLPIMAYGVL